MTPPLDQGTILITGASSGIGREIARELAPKARALVLVARRGDRLTELRNELIARWPGLIVRTQPCDLTDPAAIDAMLKETTQDVGAIDVLVNNAGLGDIGLLEGAAWEKLHEIIQVNITALTLLTRRVLGPMRAQGRGGILNISSGFGLTWMPGMAVYVGSKHYVTGFTEALRSELEGSGVVVTQVCPGPVRTEFGQVAGTGSGTSVPAFLQQDAAACARQAVRAFRNGRALYVPGFWAGIMVAIGRLTPRAVTRWFYRCMGGGRAFAPTSPGR